MKEYIMEYGAKAVFGGVLAVLTLMVKSLFKRLRLEVDEQRTMKQALLATLHDRLYHECKRILYNGKISLQEHHNLQILFQSYLALGGNGECAQLANRCFALPIKTDVTDIQPEVRS